MPLHNWSVILFIWLFSAAHFCGNCLGFPENQEIKDKYLDVYNQINSLFKGSAKKIELFLKSVMDDYANNEQYEEALQVKNILLIVALLQVILHRQRIKQQAKK